MKRFGELTSVRVD